MMQLPPEPVEVPFYEELLGMLGVPLVREVSRTRARRMVREALRIIGARMLIIDEIHALLVGGERQQRVFLNVIRLLANELENRMGARPLVGPVLIAFALLLTAVPARAAEDLVEYCRRVDTDDTTHPLPAALVPRFLRAFGLDLPVEVAVRIGSVRCKGGRVLACNAGANLPCGRADMRRSIPEADAWCQENRDADVVPAYVTGHASVYAWRCRDGRAEPVRQVAHTDGRGFVAEYWKPLD